MIEWLGAGWVLSTAPINGIAPEEEIEMEIALAVVMFGLMAFGFIEALGDMMGGW